MRKVLVLALLGIPVMLSAQPGFAQPVEDLKVLQKEIQTLKEGQAAIQKQLGEIRTLLERPAAAPAPAAGDQPQNVALTFDARRLKGAKDAKLTLVEFTDYQ